MIVNNNELWQLNYTSPKGVIWVGCSYSHLISCGYTYMGTVTDFHFTMLQASGIITDSPSSDVVLRSIT